MKTLTQKVRKSKKKINTRKSNKKYIKKQRKYTQNGRGLGDRARKFFSSSSKAFTKVTRGPVNRESMSELQEEIKRRQEERKKELKTIEEFSDKVSRDDCPLCLDKLALAVGEAGEARKVDTLEELEDVQEKSGICQPCNQCKHLFHIDCVKEMYDKNGKKSSICPYCRGDEGFREFQNKNYVTQRLQEDKKKLEELQSELRELMKELEGKKGAPPQRLEEIQTMIKKLESDIQCDTDWLDPGISEDEYIKRWPR